MLGGGGVDSRRTPSSRTNLEIGIKLEERYEYKEGSVFVAEGTNKRCVD